MNLLLYQMKQEFEELRHQRYNQDEAIAGMHQVRLPTSELRVPKLSPIHMFDRA